MLLSTYETFRCKLVLDAKIIYKYIDMFSNTHNVIICMCHILKTNVNCI